MSNVILIVVMVVAFIGMIVCAKKQKTNPNAKKYEELKYADIINRGLKVIDFTAATMCMENNVPTLAFGLNEENSIVRAVCGEQLGTLISV